MRGNDAAAGSLFSDVDLEKRVRPDHPLRVIKGVVNATLAAMSAEFDNSARIWNVLTGQQIATLIGHTAPVYSVSFSRDDTREVPALGAPATAASHS